MLEESSEVCECPGCANGKGHCCDDHDSQFGCRVCARDGLVTKCDWCGLNLRCMITKAWNESTEHMLCASCRSTNRLDLMDLPRKREIVRRSSAKTAE
jgi:hypothetical protein